MALLSVGWHSSQHMVTRMALLTFVVRAAYNAEVARAMNAEAAFLPDETHDPPPTSVLGALAARPPACLSGDVVAAGTGDGNLVVWGSTRGVASLTSDNTQWRVVATAHDARGCEVTSLGFRGARVGPRNPPKPS
eukprot:1919978-Pyramimonas_sp.AAC.1